MGATPPWHGKHLNLVVMAADPLIDVDSTRLKEASDYPAIDIYGEIDMPIALKLGNVSLGFR